MDETNKELQQRAARIKVIIFDVDGVLTDGMLYFVPQPSGGAVEVKGFSAHDGLGIGIGRVGGLRFGVITKRSSETVAVRMKELKIEFLHQGSQQKMEAIHAITQEAGVALDEIAYVGDDIIDLPPMRAVGLAVATWNARDQVKAAAHFVTPHAGGFGAGRDCIDLVLEAKGVLEESIEKYLAQAGGPGDIGHGVQ